VRRVKATRQKHGRQKHGHQRAVNSAPKAERLNLRRLPVSLETGKSEAAPGVPASNSRIAGGRIVPAHLPSTGPSLHRFALWGGPFVVGPLSECPGRFPRGTATSECLEEKVCHRDLSRAPPKGPF